jgi:Ca2+-dependent lipid-binding protein
MSSEKQPPGGHDTTPLNPTSGETYTVKITFHRAHHVPIADFGKRSADPFILAQVNTSVPTRHGHDPHLRYRSQTIHRTLEPEWNAEWVIAGVPRSGLTLKARLYDEDPDDYDDSLGKVEVETGAINEHFAIKEETYKVRKTGANFKAYALRSCLRLVDKAHDLHARLVLSVEVLGKTKEEVGKVYTINNFWWIHYSPMIGRIAGTKTNDEQGVEKFK